MIVSIFILKKRHIVSIFIYQIILKWKAFTGMEQWKVFISTIMRFIFTSINLNVRFYLDLIKLKINYSMPIISVKKLKISKIKHL